MNPISGYLKIIGGIVLAVVLAATLVKTYDFGYHSAQAVGDRNLADYKASVDRAAASSVGAAFADYASGVARGQAAETQFFVDQRAADSHAASIKEQIDHVAQPHIAAPTRALAAASSSASDPVYRCVFSRGFVRLWNAAAGIADDHGAAVQAGADSSGTTLGAGADEAADSGVSQADILDWLVDFANVKHADEAKLRSIRELQQPVSNTATPASTVPATE